MDKVYALNSREIMFQDLVMSHLGRRMAITVSCTSSHTLLGHSYLRGKSKDTGMYRQDIVWRHNIIKVSVVNETPKSTCILGRK